MTKGEFYKKKLESINEMKKSIAIKNDKPEPCNVCVCAECIRNTGEVGCYDLPLIEWYNSEYIPPKPKLTKYEKAVLSLLEKGFMARDANRNLYRYENIPSRKRDEWCLNGGSVERVNIGITEKAKFQFIKWKDAPISIEEMLTWEVDE